MGKLVGAISGSVPVGVERQQSLELDLVPQPRPNHESLVNLKKVYDEVCKDTDRNILHQLRSAQHMLGPTRRPQLSANPGRTEIEAALRFEKQRLGTLAQQVEYCGREYYGLQYDIDDALSTAPVFANRMSELHQEPAQ